MQNTPGGILAILSSFIRTITVGSGFAPDLLTPVSFDLRQKRSARGLSELLGLPPVGNCTLP